MIQGSVCKTMGVHYSGITACTWVQLRRSMNHRMIVRLQSLLQWNQLMKLLHHCNIAESSTLSKTDKHYWIIYLWIAEPKIQMENPRASTENRINVLEMIAGVNAPTVPNVERTEVLLRKSCKWQVIHISSKWRNALYLKTVAICLVQCLYNFLENGFKPWES